MRLETDSTSIGRIWRPERECAAVSEIRGRSAKRLRTQIQYLQAFSAFYQQKLKESGPLPKASLGDEAVFEWLKTVPFTTKDELRRSQQAAPPFGLHLACAPAQIRCIYQSSGTTGVPVYIPLTERDLSVSLEFGARTYTALGIKSASTVVSTFAAGPFVAGNTYRILDRLKARVIPLGPGHTARVIAAFQDLGADTLMGTVSYARYLMEQCCERGLKPSELGMKLIIVGGEPGGGEPATRSQLESTFNCRVREVMGVGEIGGAIFGECYKRTGMHFNAQDLLWLEIIDSKSGNCLRIETGVEGELVYTVLAREAAPLLRYRSNDHVRVLAAEPCECGRTSVRLRCVGRLDDMIIVRGVNVFPSAVQDIVERIGCGATGSITIKLLHDGTSQEAPLHILVGCRDGDIADRALAERIENEVHSCLSVRVKVHLTGEGQLVKSEYKRRLLDVDPGFFASRRE